MISWGLLLRLMQYIYLYTKVWDELGEIHIPFKGSEPRGDPFAHVPHVDSVSCDGVAYIYIRHPHVAIYYIFDLNSRLDWSSSIHK